MFEKALITRVGSGHRHVDIGLLAETVFFYGSTQLVLNRSSLSTLATRFSSDELVSFIDRSNIKISFLQPSFGVLSQGMPRTHNFVSFVMGGKKQKKMHYKAEIFQILERSLGNSETAKKLTRALCDRVSLHKFKGTAQKEGGILSLARDDVKDQHFVEEAIRSLIGQLVPDYELPSPFIFRIYRTQEGYWIDTNIEFSEINKLYHKVIPSTDSSLSPEFLLSFILEARAESYLASNYMSDLVTVPYLSKIIRIKHFDFLLSRESSLKEIELFKEVVIPDFPDIREAINNGDRSLSEFLRLLDEAEKFRSWLQSANQDEGLLRSYQKAATRRTWADRLPSKVVRFAIASGVGILADALFPTGVGTVGGISIGALDNFYLDKLLKGWRPNQFIEGPYKTFLSGQDKSEFV